jgi:uncharacterized protein (TIGR03435 family)
MGTSTLPVFVWIAAISGMLTGPLLGQSQTGRRPTFEAASVRLSTQDTSHPQGFRVPSAVIRGISGSRLTERYITLTELIMQAYDAKDYQISGAPDWSNWNRGDQFDIVAKAEGDGTPSISQFRLMLQSLLAERFRLKLHRATKELPVYELLIGRNGSKLREVGSDATPLTAATMGITRRQPLNMLVEVLSMRLDRPVIDKTGLPDKTYEFPFDQISLSRCDHQGDETFACVSEWIQKQLGLELDMGKDSIQLLLIDHVEKPTSN